MSSEKRERVLGIDLGTTNSAAAVTIGGKATIIPSAEGPTAAGKMFPSVALSLKADNCLSVRAKTSVVRRAHKSSARWAQTIR
jgi:molecular chaperone DnaK (HSP70)